MACTVSTNIGHGNHDGVDADEDEADDILITIDHQTYSFL